MLFGAPDHFFVFFTAGIRRSLNISSTTDNSNGNHDVNFTNAWTATDYILMNGGGDNDGSSHMQNLGGVFAVNTFKTIGGNKDGALEDHFQIHYGIIGELA